MEPSRTRGCVERPIAVSNIAWAGHSNEPFLDILASEGAQGLELAASLVWSEPVETTAAQRAEWRSTVESRGLVITGLHALLFTRPDLQLLAAGENRQRVREYLMRTIDLCAELGGQYMVMGGPKNRRRGDLSVEEAEKRGASILHQVGEYAARCGCFFALEALPAPGCDFITNLRECEEMVRLADSSGVRLHLDSGAADITDGEATDDALVKILRRAYHCHVNDFDLLPPGSKTPADHQRSARLLTDAGYEGWVSIEMRCTATPEETVRQAIRFVRSTYIISTSQEAQHDMT